MDQQEGDPAEHEREELRVSTLELFFDLVFVFTLTQLTAFLEHHLELEGVLQTLLIFAVLFWMYGGYAYLTNQMPPINRIRRLLLIGGMIAFFVCALALPESFGDGGLAFGIGYLAVVVIHAGLYGSGYGWNIWRFASANFVSAVLIIAAAFVDGTLKYILWTAPLILQIIATRLTSQAADQSRRFGLAIRTDHFVERHGLLLLVAFGESVVAIGIGLGDIELTPEVLGAAALALAVVAALWWSFFEGDDERAERALRAAPLDHRLRKALAAYFYWFSPLLLGVVILAAGLALALHHAFSPLSLPEALLIGGGVALFLVSDVGFRVTLGIRPILSRAAAAIAALLTVAVGAGVSAIVQIVALLAILVVLLLGEAVFEKAGRQRTSITGT